MDYETLTAEEVERGILMVTLNRPDRMNAMTFRMFDEFAEVCDAAARDDAVRVVILTGAGRGFCSGMDLDVATQFPSMSVDEFLVNQERWGRGVSAFRLLNKPVIAAVNGPAAGAGFGLALAADVRIASPRARFIASFMKIGFSASDVGITWALPRLIGLSRATEILLSARDVDAEESQRIGLVAEVVPDAELRDAALRRARRMIEFSPLAVGLTVSALQANADSPFEAAIELENRNQTLCSRSENMPEALAAFREKRSPRWVSR